MTNCSTLPLEHEPRLRQLLRVFLQENQKLNLSAFRTEETCWIGNILDSLAFLDVLPVMVRRAHHDTQKILDLGTGGGFPLLPLAICMPKHHFTGIDATRKKIDAVQRIVEALSLTNVDMLWGRAEALGKDPAHDKKYDIVLSRAVAKLPELLMLSAAFLKPGGYAVFWKSMSMDEELRLSQPIQEKLDFSLISTHCYTLPNDFGQRQLLIFQKTPGALHYPP